MKTPHKIIIEIPKPCQEDWEQMMPDAQGRFCGHCQKSVIDFTQWSDERLYQYFAGNTNPVCGRFQMTQVGRNISLPPQPHSRLYRIAVALGLTLIFTQTSEQKSYARTPIVFQSPFNNLNAKNDTTGNDTTGIKGIVTDAKHQPIINAAIKLMKGSVIVAITVSDSIGKYQFTNLASGRYSLVASSEAYKTGSITNIIYSRDTATEVNLILYSDADIHTHLEREGTIKGKRVLPKSQ